MSRFAVKVFQSELRQLEREVARLDRRGVQSQDVNALTEARIHIAEASKILADRNDKAAPEPYPSTRMKEA